MLDLKTMLAQQKRGESQITSLDDDEKTIVQSYCYLAANELLKMGAQKGALVNEVVMNAFKSGLALGSQLSINNNRVDVRRL